MVLATGGGAPNMSDHVGGCQVGRRVCRQDATEGNLCCRIQLSGCPKR